jgi:hypothetical protein
MRTKHVLLPRRLRQIPAQFSWVDQRLVRDKHIEQCSPPSLALYLFLVTVADHKGLSYYSGTSIGRILAMDEKTLSNARSNLEKVGLIAYEEPLYQVLDLAPRACEEVTPLPSSAGPGPLSFGQILARIAGQKP